MIDVVTSCKEIRLLPKLSYASFSHEMTNLENFPRAGSEYLKKVRECEMVFWLGRRELPATWKLTETKPDASGQRMEMLIARIIMNVRAPRTSSHSL